MPGNRCRQREEVFMRSRLTPARERTFGRWLRHLIRRNPWHDRAECERIAALTFPARPVRSIAPDTLIVYRQRESAPWPDGLRSPEDFVAVVLHRQPFARPHNRLPLGSDRTVYVSNGTRAEAIAKLAAHV
jgi:hypothetical protein